MTDAKAGPEAIPPGDWIGFLAMCIGMFMAILDIQIVASSLPRIGSALGIGENGLSWIQTAYLIPEIIAIPLTGFLTRALSLRWLFAGSTLAFALASLACALSSNFGELILFRALQGFSGGALIPAVFTSVFVIFPRRAHAMATVVAGSFAMIAPTLGPILGGYLTETYSWHVIFLINVVPGIVVALFVIRFIRADKLNLSLLKSIDYSTVVLAALFLSSLMLLLKEGPKQSWHGSDILLLALFSTVSLAITIQQCLSRPHPFVHLWKFADPSFRTGALLSFTIGIGLYGATYLMPVFLGYAGRQNPLQIGEIMIVAGIAQLGAAPVAALVEPRLSPKWLGLFGFALFGAGLIANGFMTPRTLFDGLFWPQVLRGVAVMACILPATRFALDHWPEAEVADASALFNLMRNMGGAIGIALVDTVLQERAPVHVERLVERLQAGERTAAQFAGLPLERFTGHPLGPIDAFTRALVKPLVERAALTLASNEAWLLAGAIFVAATLLLLLAPRSVGRTEN